MAQNKNNNGSDDALWVMGGIMLALFAGSYFLQKYWKYGRVELYEFYTKWTTYLFDSLNMLWVLPTNFLGITEFLHVYENNEITKEEVSRMAMQLTPYFVLPLIAILVFLYMKGYSKKGRYNRIFTKKSLIHDQKKRWPWLYPIADLEFDPDIEKGKWAMAKRPLDYVKKYQLFDKNLNIIEEKATVLLANQIGRLYSGYESLKDYEKALFLIFAAHAEMSKQSKKDAINWVSITNITHENPDYSWLDEAYKKYGNTQKVKEVEARHAYVSTVLMGMLEQARGGDKPTGVFQTALILWLKPVDRTLYFALNNVSQNRREGFVECCGVLNHFYAEKSMKRPLLRQYVEDALNGLKFATSEANVKITNKNYYDLVVE